MLRRIREEADEGFSKHIAGSGFFAYSQSGVCH
jgi:hypothetical protein